ncbi:hypothetical protein [Gordonia sihwensis]|uniref:hypothetical protein n=1 Tax=Gordonia sihwensis TaxID=173559 RepID=UPI0005EE1573|nr:hypothetical protein [Gordonia sihwensis]KJR10286.1 hypothetical protein UG54_01535 [Gordonia sihwensis]
MCITATTSQPSDRVLTVEDLGQLPNDTVIRADDGAVFEREQRGWYTIGVSQPERNLRYLVPANVLYRP